MKHTKKIFAAVLAVQMLMAAGVCAQAADSAADVPAAQASSSSEPAISPRKDSIVWRYKAIDGHVYRRQYNESKQKWIGEWERC